MTSEGLGEMFEGDSADKCAGKFPFKLMGGRAEGLACAYPGASNPSLIQVFLMTLDYQQKQGFIGQKHAG